MTDHKYYEIVEYYPHTVVEYWTTGYIFIENMEMTSHGGHAKNSHSSLLSAKPWW